MANPGENEGLLRILSSIKMLRKLTEEGYNYQDTEKAMAELKSLSDKRTGNFRRMGDLISLYQSMLAVTADAPKEELQRITDEIHQLVDVILDNSSQSAAIQRRLSLG